MCFFYMPYHFTTPQTSTNHKKAEMDNLIGTKFRCSHQNMIHRLRHNDKSLFAETGARRPLNFSPPKEETNGEEVRQMHRLKQAHSCSHYEGVDFRSRRRHRCLRFCVLQIIGQRSQLDSMRSQFLWDMLDMANAPLQVARAKENMENIIEELHSGP